ncbi:transmembrane protein 106a, partial [Plakobranchus ocellatus]
NTFKDTEMYKTCSKLPQVLRGRTYSPMEEEGVPSARSPMNSPGTETSNGSVAHSSSRKNVRCPTCNGIGWVRKEEEGQLVALIPLNDQRLKPRRTVVYVLLAVALCLVTGGLCCFFLYPRDVRLDSNRPLLQPPIVNFTDTAVVFRVTNYFNLTNDNFYPTPIKSMSVSAMMYKKQLASNKWRGNTKVKREVPSRSRLSLPINITFRFSKKTEPNLV